MYRIIDFLGKVDSISNQFISHCFSRIHNNHAVYTKNVFKKTKKTCNVSPGCASYIPFVQVISRLCKFSPVCASYIFPE